MGMNHFYSLALKYYVLVYVILYCKNMTVKNICASKDTIKKVERQPTNWEKIFCKSYT